MRIIVLMRSGKSAWEGRSHCVTYGRRLLEFAEDQAHEHGLSELRLYTNEHMTENFGYYQHLGFEITGRRTEDGYHRVFMRKRVYGV